MEEDSDNNNNINIDEPLGVKFDEFQAVATHKSLLFKGARLEKQRLEMDFVNVDKEFQEMIRKTFLPIQKDSKGAFIRRKKKERVRESLITDGKKVNSADIGRFRRRKIRGVDSIKTDLT